MAVNEHEQALLDRFEYGPGDDFQVAFWPGDGPEYFRIVRRYYNFDPKEEYPTPMDHHEYELMSPATSGWETRRVTEHELLHHYQEIDEIPDEVTAG